MEIVFTKRNKNNVCDAIEGKKSYKKLTAAEWHQFVQNYNYDDGNEPFEWLVKQKICDKGTALCLYWHLQPDFFCDKEKAAKSDMFDDDYALIQEIERRFLDGFYETELFCFDPAVEFLTPETNVACIPEVMREKTKGEPFERVDVEYAFLRPPNEKELKTIDKKIKDALAILRQTNPNLERADAAKTVTEIKNCVEHWQGKDLGKLKINDLSYLWLDCLREKYGWSWIAWDWETGRTLGVANQSRALTCLADTLIRHTVSGFQPASIIAKLFNDLNGVEKMIEMQDKTYGGIGLLFASEHLQYREDGQAHNNV